MELYNFYLASQSIYAIVATIFILILAFIVVILYYKINAISKKVDKIAETGMETSRDVRGFVERTITQIEQLSKSILTFDAAKKLALTIIEALNKNKKESKARK